MGFFCGENCAYYFGYISFRQHCIVFIMAGIARGDVSYSLSEEMKIGSVIGNIAKDLGLNLNSLSARKARIDAEGTRRKYCDINVNNGELTVLERIDREGLCGKKSVCILKQELVLENPLESHRININVQDVNDNSPVFKKGVVKLEIGESAVKGSRFLLEEAHDADIGTNSVQTYTVSRNEHFSLAVSFKTGGRISCELVLGKELDRELEKEVTLILTAVDGGTPPRSGTVAIHVTVLDANDNFYSAHVKENNKPGYSVCTIAATDPDWRQNGTVVYSLFTYNYDAYLTTGSRTSDFKFVSSYNDRTLPADLTLKKGKSVEDMLRCTGDELLSLNQVWLLAFF
uniref:Cadherin domain-containing protein n=1 Tax=Astyanax mexicanus TaxID=7994 RepID=A0A3B1IQI3_ASTMX